MNLSRRSISSVALLALACLACASWLAWRSPAPSAQQGAPPSLVSANHKLLEKYVGSWDTEMKAAAVPGQPPQVTKGKSSSKLIGGGVWLVTDFEGSMMGMPFIGHEVMGYDNHAKQYILNWVDTSSTAMFSGEMQFDDKTHTLAGTIHGHDEAGVDMKWRATDEWKDADTHEYAMHMKMGDGPEMEMLRITYKRHK